MCWNLLHDPGICIFKTLRSPDKELSPFPSSAIYRLVCKVLTEVPERHRPQSYLISRLTLSLAPQEFKVHPPTEGCWFGPGR